jgi:SAM-dependent methyltransferase
MVAWPHDLYWDWRIGAWTGGVIKTSYKEQGANNTESIHYGVLRHLFRQIPVRPEDVLVDVGCGKGRVVGWWVTAGYRNQIIGVELDPRVATATAARFAGVSNVRVIAGDIIANFPAEGNVFWLYNPFDLGVMRDFRDRLKQVGRTHARIVYFNARHMEAFREDPCFVCEALDPGWLATCPCYLIQLRGADPAPQGALPVRSDLTN